MINKRKEFSYIPAIMAVIILCFAFRLIDFVQVVQNNQAYLSSAIAFAAEEAEEEPEEEMPAEGGPKENVLENAQKTQASANKKPKWRDATEEDFAFQGIQMEHQQQMEAQRLKLEERARDLDAREALLQAAEQELRQKHKELVQIRAQIEDLLGNQEEAEKAQIQSLVKIYEGMKAKEAAAIFNSLDIDILLEVMGSMSERKAAPILAKMNPERAKTVTVMLAERKKLPDLTQ